MQDSTEAVAHPTLEVEGVKYVSKYTTGALIRLQREGVDLEKFAPEPELDEQGNPVMVDGKPKLKERKWPLELCFQLLAACISSGKRKFTGEELADLIPANRTAEAVQVLTATFSKAQPQASEPTNAVQ